MTGTLSEKNFVMVDAQETRVAIYLAEVRQASFSSRYQLDLGVSAAKS